jgi:hypothetical protein
MIATHRRFDEARPVIVAAHQRQPKMAGVRAFVRSVRLEADRGSPSGAKMPCERLADHLAQFLIIHRG